MDGKPIFYDLHTKPLLDKYHGLNEDIIYDKAADDLIPLVRDGTIWFPFQKHFRGEPNQLFENLKTIDLPRQNREKYRLYSYYPKYGSYLPPKFRGKPTIVSGTRGTYETADVLSDHYIEDIRLKAKRYDQKYSILECWAIDSCLKEILKNALHKDRITPVSLRETIYETIAETKIFNPTWARAILKLVIGDNLSGKKWLDISAGWGDRLIAAMSLDMDYVGFDPNIELKPGHSEMTTQLSKGNRSYQVIYEPFEKATIPDGPYDVVFSSPPYFTIEEYAPGQEGQSIVSYPDFDQWMVWFLFKSLEKAWNHLKEGGYLILHLGDAKTIITSEATNIFIENYLPGASWEGVIGLQGEAGYPRPVWVWKKVARTVTKISWEPEQAGALNSNKRTLYNTYYSLQIELIRSMADKYAPYYTIRRSSAAAVRDYVKIALQNLNIVDDVLNGILNSVINDDLMISSLLEVKQSDGTIQFLSDFLSEHNATPPNILRPLLMEQVDIVAPYYNTRRSSSHNVRAHVKAKLPMVDVNIIDDILQDDLMISSLLETLNVSGTITWATAMVKLALHV